MISVINSLRYRFLPDEDRAEEEEVLAAVRNSVEFKGINLWTLIFAVFIASIGLNINSTAVIIGAMLISPLMGPIMGIGTGAGIYDFVLIKRAVLNLMVALSIALFTSALYFYFTPLQQAQSELLARTTPTIYDVGVAFLGGLAGIVASFRKKYNNVIPGVAIATALMPPLCTAGYGLATAQWSFFFGAFYLFVINSVFISIAVFLMIRYFKFQPVHQVNSRTTLKIKRYVLSIAIVTILPSLYLAYHYVRNEIFQANAERMINNELIKGGYPVFNTSISAEDNLIEITVMSHEGTDSVAKYLESKAGNYELAGAEIRVKDNNGFKDYRKQYKELKSDLIKEVLVKQSENLKIKNDEISVLKKQQLIQQNFNDKRKDAVREFPVLFGNFSELMIEQSTLFTGRGSDTLLLVYVSIPGKGSDRLEVQKMNEWFRVKFNTEKVKLFFYKTKVK